MNYKYLLWTVSTVVILVGGGCHKKAEVKFSDTESSDTSQNETDSSGSGVYSNLYQWGQLKIGGGGYVTGIVIHPKDKNIMYIRTDVGGAYRWDVKNHRWDQLLNWISPEQSNLGGVDGLAIDPSNPDRIYLALGENIDQKGGIYRSEDKGEDWHLLKSAKYAGNSDGRWTGECIAVDPNSSKIIYAGTRKDGLWRSKDDGTNWSRVADVPFGTNSIGIRSVVFDPVAKIDDHSSIIYVGVSEKGIYRSTDGGSSFSLMQDSPVNPSRMQVVNQELFVTHSEGVVLWSQGNWNNISPENGKNYDALAVDKTNSNRIIVAQHYDKYNNPIYRSENKGQTWEQIVPAKFHINIPWLSKDHFSAATASIAIVPGGTGEFFLTDWHGIWETPDIWSDETEWATIDEGHEEAVILTLVAPPKGALVYSGMMDRSGFRHQSINIAPSKTFYPINEGFSISVCEKKPNNLAFLGAKDWYGSSTSLFTSSDYGETWSYRNLPSGSKLGRIAISSSDPSNMVYLSGEGDVYYTINKGNSWESSQKPPSNFIKKTAVWTAQFQLAANRENDNFYLFNNGFLYVSNDKGMSWRATNITPIPSPTSSSSNVSVVPAPGREKEIWISLNQKGLWKTVDEGKTFHKVSYFDNSRKFSLGAPAPDKNFPTAYCYGKAGGFWGLYRSIDEGNTWVRINDDKHQFVSSVNALAADRQNFGQIYVGTGGNGVFYGRLIN